MRPLLSQYAWEVAPKLLGWTLTHTTDEGTVAVRLTEVEAYEGESDPASHASRGPTKRNAIMYGEPGLLYVYRIYGLHWACNVVTGPAGRASAVLLRAGAVIEGANLARMRRGASTREHALARGPGCFAQALGLTGEHNGLDVLRNSMLKLAPAKVTSTHEVASGHRVGVTKAHDVPWRFWIEGEPTVSAYRRSPRIV